MWINAKMSLPLKRGVYKSLVDSDGLGSLIECLDEHFNGVDWVAEMSNAQFITHWWATTEEYREISKTWENEIGNLK